MMADLIKNWKTPESTAWNVLLVFCLILIVIESLAVTGAFHFEGTGSHTSVLAIHGLAALFVLILLLTQKNFWTKNRCIAVYLLLFSPAFYISWDIEIAYSELKYWVPFGPFKFQIMAAALLVPGPYWINLCLMIGLCMEAIFMWYYLDTPHAPNIVLTSEPFTTIIFVIWAFLFIGFRFRDQMIIEKLSRQKARSEIHEKVARIFMSMRDKINTPLQTQKIVVQILRKDTSAINKVMDPLEHSVLTLSEVNTIIGRLQSDLPQSSYILMTENEISEFLDDLESSRGLIQQANQTQVL